MSSERVRSVRQVLVLLRADDLPSVERVVQAIEELDGRVRESYPPYAIVAELPDEQLDPLRGRPDVKSVEVDVIADYRIAAATEPLCTAMMVWNRRLSGQRGSHRESVSGLSWDAPGCLPPDPPPDIQALLRRRERELQTDDDTAAES